MHEQMYPSFLNTDREAIANVRFTWLFMHFQCLFQIFDNIIHIFDTDGKTDHSRRNSCFNQLLIVHLAMCMAGGVKDHSDGSGNVSCDGGKLQTIHKTDCCITATGQFKGDNAAGTTILHIFLSQCVIFILRKSCVIYMRNLFVCVQVFCNLLGVGAMRSTRSGSVSRPRFRRKQFIGDGIEPRSRISWEVALVM